MAINKDNLINKFGIHIKVSDLDASYDFYRKLGFKETFAYGNKHFLSKLDKSIPTAPEKYRGVVFEIGNSLFEIADGHLAVKPEVFKQKIKCSKVSAMLHVNSLSEVLQRCKKHKIDVAVPPRKFPWGTREIVIKDPDGFVLVFIEKLKS